MRSCIAAVFRRRSERSSGARRSGNVAVNQRKIAASSFPAAYLNAAFVVFLASASTDRYEKMRIPIHFANPRRMPDGFQEVVPELEPRDPELRRTSSLRIRH